MESMDRYCWSCGSGIYKNDRFCRKCGADLVQRQPIEQGHETQPEDSYTPPTPIPEVAVKEVSTAPTSSLLFKLLPGLWDFLQPDSVLFKIFPGLWDMRNRTPTPTSTATAPSPKPELEKSKTPLWDIPTRTPTPTSYVKLGFSRTFDYEGRSSKPEFWVFWLFILLSALGIALLVGLTGGSEDIVGGIGLLYGFFLLPSYIALTVRRLHDTNRSGFWFLVSLVPLGYIVLLVFCAIDGDKEPNKYGPGPRTATSQPPELR